MGMKPGSEEFNAYLASIDEKFNAIGFFEEGLDENQKSSRAYDIADLIRESIDEVYVQIKQRNYELAYETCRMFLKYYSALKEEFGFALIPLQMTFNSVVCRCRNNKKAGSYVFDRLIKDIFDIYDQKHDYHAFLILRNAVPLSPVNRLDELENAAVKLKKIKDSDSNTFHESFIEELCRETDYKIILKSKGVDAANTFLYDNLDCPPIHEIAIENAFKNKDYKEAKRLYFMDEPDSSSSYIGNTYMRNAESLKKDDKLIAVREMLSDNPDCVYKYYTEKIFYNAYEKNRKRNYLPIIKDLKFCLKFADREWVSGKIFEFKERFPQKKLLHTMLDEVMNNA
jgi:hypothetical protein